MCIRDSSRYTVRAQEESPDYEIYQLKSGDNWLVNSTKQIGSKLIGFEGNDMSVNMLNQLITSKTRSQGLIDLGLLTSRYLLFIIA